MNERERGYERPMHPQLRVSQNLVARGSESRSQCERTQLDVLSSTNRRI